MGIYFPIDRLHPRMWIRCVLVHLTGDGDDPLRDRDDWSFRTAILDEVCDSAFKRETVLQDEVCFNKHPDITWRRFVDMGITSDRYDAY